MRRSSPVILPPAPDEYPEWFAEEIELVHYQNLLMGLEDMYTVSHALLHDLDETQLLSRYQEGKWTIKEMWQHVIDVERVLAYRSLRFARNDKTVLHGFDHEAYVVESLSNERSWDAMLEEFRLLRQSTIELFQSFTPEMVMRRGTAGRSEVTVRAVGYLILGHNIHHLKVVREKYL